MACGSGTSASSQLPKSGSDEDIQALINQRKLKRMLSNRESARRSRVRKQKHMDDLMAQVNRLREENNQILVALNLTTQHYMGMEAENSVLRTRLMDLKTRLKSLNEIIYHYTGASGRSGTPTGCFLMNPRPWSIIAMNQLPIVASMDIFQDYPAIL